MVDTSTSKGNDAQERHKVLLRQIETKVSHDGKNTDKSAQVSFGKLISLASGGEKCQLYVGWIFAAITGATLPLFFFFIGPVFDSFGPLTTPEDTRDKVREVAIIMGGITAVVLLASFFQNWLLLTSSTNVTARLKTNYLRSVLNQESAWFDQENYTELSSRLGKECDTIQRGIGQKFGQIIYSFAMCISGLFVAFYKGWSLSFAMLGIAPIMLIGMAIFSSVMMKRASVTMRAYGQSAGYAEQALSAIRIVVSFGQEELEINNYTRFLVNVTEATLKGGLATGLSMGFFFLCIYCCYAYCFLIGAIWVDKPYFNDVEDRNYLAGDCLSVFFGVLFGLFALGGAGPAFSAVNEAKAAGKVAFEIIDRVPVINQDAPDAKKHVVKGEIEFKNVDFYYPSRPDAPIMTNFSYKFALGKTTAIVGPSGSGKSTTVQLTERFYDPSNSKSNGMVLIDGVDLKTINLRNYRQQIGYVGQEPVLFNTSIKNNILMGKPDATDAEIEDALRQTNSWGFVSENPEGINRNVGTGGGQLSGGQKQRIALARAFIKKPRLLIFDEATSALDKVNEAEVQKAIDKMKAELGQVTTLVIAHRLSTIKNADTIIVLKKGQLVEEGNHDSLLRDYPNGIYAKLCKGHDQQEEKQAVKDQSVNISAQELASLQQQLPAELVSLANATKSKQLKQVKADEMDPQALKMFGEAEKIRIADEAKIVESLDHITNPKKASKTFRTNLARFTNNTVVFFGCLFTFFVGIICPLYGWFIMECMTRMNIAAYAGTSVTDATTPYVLAMFGSAVLLFFVKSASMILLSRVAEKIVQGVRKDLYQSILRKNIGWHDDRDNSSGVMTATLSSDVQLLNGVSSDGIAVAVEAGTALLFGVSFAFYWSWPMALVCIGTIPVIMIGGAIAAKADNSSLGVEEETSGENDKSDDTKQSQILATDSIANYKTVASFGNDQILINEFDGINMRQARTEDKASLMYALSLGISVALQNGIFALLYLASAELYAKWPTEEVMQQGNQFIAMFVFIFGAFTAAQGASLGPDVAKATKAATKIFSIIERPSKIDALAKSSASSSAAEAFNGTIEFKDVWFRYPTRLQKWVFKGLNLKINQNDVIAIVGESGQGKSTFINLVMRFYDPEFGTVLVNGVDVKSMDVATLRQKLGLVMQEPILFNYSLLENILYGKLKASNQEVYEAAKIAHALEFIESKEMGQAFSDDAASLKTAMQSAEFKEGLIAQIKLSVVAERNEKIKKGDIDMNANGSYTEMKRERDGKVTEIALKNNDSEAQARFDNYFDLMGKLSAKAEAEGIFEAIGDLVDSRDAAQKGNLKNLHAGFGIFAGTRGSKLSGGQKQRIAIARAVIRQPQILLLDEATSALDEESQRLVQEALYEIMKNRTSIVIAHRLTTVEKCTRLAVIEDGKIVEEGSFKDLTEKDNGYFANMASGMRKAEKKEQKRGSILVAAK